MKKREKNYNNKNKNMNKKPELIKTDSQTIPALFFFLIFCLVKYLLA